jgi:hypothetical protein
MSRKNLVCADSELSDLLFTLSLSKIEKSRRSLQRSFEAICLGMEACGATERLKASELSKFAFPFPTLKQSSLRLWDAVTEGIIWLG